MKLRLLSCLTLCTLSICSLSAQTISCMSDKANARIEKFRSERMAFILSQVSLEESEIQTLNEILRANDAQKFKLWSEMIEIHKSTKQEKKPSDDEYREKIRRLIDLERKQTLLLEELALELQKKFSPEKSYVIYTSIKYFYSRKKKNKH